MSDNIAIKVEQLSKQFVLQRPAKDEQGNDVQTLWALKDVSFEIKQGESVGIIGHNGSGKSTLLKILAGVTKPTSGRVEMNGRIASILDIGAGFHPELSGRENIFLNGQIHGFSYNAIEAKLDEIISFSGIETFIHEPVKNYSNGMYLRLAFSIMAHLDFDVYLFDEVLSVGDAEFSMKTKSKFQELLNSNKTIVFVSHNINELLGQDSYILFEEGKIKEKTKEKTLLSSYLEDILKSENITIYTQNATLNDLQQYATSEDVKVNRIEFYQEENPHHFTTSRPFTLLVEYEKLKSGYTLDMMLNVSDLQGKVIITSAPFIMGNTNKNEHSGIYTYKCVLEAPIFNSQVYQISLNFIKNLSKYLDTVEGVERSIDMNLMVKSDIEVSLAMQNIVAFKPVLETTKLKIDPNNVMKGEVGLLPNFKWESY